MELGEAFPAVQSAEMAVKLSPSWATGRQTLGRSQLGIGEVHMVSNSAKPATLRWNVSLTLSPISSSRLSEALRRLPILTLPIVSCGKKTCSGPGSWLGRKTRWLLLALSGGRRRREERRHKCDRGCSQGQQSPALCRAIYCPEHAP